MNHPQFYPAVKIGSKWHSPPLDDFARLKNALMNFLDNITDDTRHSLPNLAAGFEPSLARKTRLSSTIQRLLLLLGFVSSALFATAEVPLRVVTLHTVLTEIAQEVGGSDVSVTALVKPGVDPHGYEPSASDIVPVTKADLVLACGLHLEIYLERIASNARVHGKMFKVGDALPVLLASNGCSHAKEEHSAVSEQRVLLSDKGEPDPHWWHSIDNVVFATDLIRAEFSLLRPASAESFARNAQRYQQRLFALKAWAARTVSSLPPERRVIITTHDAFGYLAHDWGFSVHAVNGLSTDIEPGARHVAELIEIIKRLHVPAVFVEHIANPKTIEVIAREGGARLGGALYADGLGAADSPAATYEAMMRYNISTLVNGLR